MCHSVTKKTSENAGTFLPPHLCHAISILSRVVDMPSLHHNPRAAYRKDFDIERFAVVKVTRDKGFQPVNDPLSYLMRVVRQIELDLSLGTRTAVTGADELARWG
jgi:hypothetical protein